MIIGIDANALARKNFTGTERYVLELLREMRKMPLQGNEEIHLYVSKYLDEFNNLPKGWKQIVLKWPLKKIWTHVRLSIRLLLNPPDIFFSPAHEIPIFHRKCKIITTVHDIAFQIMPEIYKENSRKRQEWAIKRAIRLANKIFTVSEVTKQDLINYYRVSKSRIIVTPLGIHQKRMQVDQKDVLEVCKKYILGIHQYFITVGRIEKKKNINMIVNAFIEYINKGGKFDLVLAGGIGEGGDEIIDKILKLAVSDRIHLLGYVPENDLAPLISGSLAYVFPTNYEGFGIPVLESFAAHVPLIASNIPALNEVADDAAIFVKKNDLHAWANGMKKLEGDQELRASLVLRGQERLRDFKWDKTAQITLDTIRNL